MRDGTRFVSFAVAAGAALVLLGCSPSGPEQETDSELVDPSCPSGAFYNPDTSSCAPEVDVQSELLAADSSSSIALPDLTALRATVDGSPTVSIVGAGVTWNAGHLRAVQSSTLFTKMTVHPEGVGSLQGTLFSTATNRTEKTVEVTGWYDHGLSGGYLAIFDWSCMRGHPCVGGNTTPSWVLTKPLTQVSCNYKKQNPGDGHLENAIYYANQSVEQADHSWLNKVLLWNYCYDRWDTVYTHRYAGPLRDCSVANGCAWWGPILETHVADPQVSIREIDFFGSKLFHDGFVSHLSTQVSSFTQPHPHWRLFFLHSNDAWGAGD